jgi:nucleoside diphosphate kinase
MLQHTMQHEQFQHQNMLQANTMANERFELQTNANIVEMAALSSKTLQIARKMDGTGNPKKSHNGKQNPQTIPDPLFISDLR